MTQYTYQDEAGRFNAERLMDELVAALAAYGVLPYLQSKPDGSAVAVEVADSVPKAVIDAIIAAHDPAQPGLSEIASKQRQASRMALEALDPTVVAAMPPDQLAQVVADLVRLVI